MPTAEVEKPVTVKIEDDDDENVTGVGEVIGNPQDDEEDWAVAAEDPYLITKMPHPEPPPPPPKAPPPLL